MHSTPSSALSDVDLKRIVKIAYDASGIVLDASRRALIFRRLQPRLQARNVASFDEYLHILQRGDPDGVELGKLVNCISTNKTSFFREEHQFTVLRAELRKQARLRPESRRLRIWCAGCSTGEEAYSIAASVAEALGPALPTWDVRILATDIDTDVLGRADRAMYERESVASLPPWAAHYFERVCSGDDVAWRVKPELRELVVVRQLNLIADEWPPFKSAFDFIFCRNVMIYFDRPTQAKLYRRFAKVLREDGAFFAGPAEDLLEAHGVFERIADATYRRAPSATTTSPPSSAAVRPTCSTPAATIPAVFIQVGGVHASRTPTLVKTTLGSCVAVCLYDPIVGVGGMNHFMLPGTSASEANTRYGVHAMEVLINALMKLGADRGRLTAKIAGACAVLDENGVSGVADDNIGFTEAFLEAERIPIVARRTGGRNAMDVRFRTDNGQAFVKRVSIDASGVRNGDAVYRATLAKQASTDASVGDVTWFR